MAAEEHPINRSDWQKVYGEPTTKPGSIHVDELTAWYADKTPGKDFVVVDVRRSDCEVSGLPTLIFLALPFLIYMLTAPLHLDSTSSREPSTCPPTHYRRHLQPLLRCSRPSLSWSSTATRAKEEGREQQVG